jgi:REP element-mobilizing transposase RayT
MPNRRTAFLAGEFYHLYNRGVDRAAVFFGDDNYRYFMRLLIEKAELHAVGIVTFCLMPSHFHFLVRPTFDATVGRFINSLRGSYVQGLNAARHRVGPLFQGRYKSVHVDRNEYLAHLARYIHLNPAAANLVARPQDWPYSNYRSIPMDGVLVGGLFRDAASYRSFVEAPEPLELPASLKLAGS